MAAYMTVFFPNATRKRKYYRELRDDTEDEALTDEEIYARYRFTRGNA